MKKLSNITLLLCCLIAACAGTEEKANSSQRTMDRIMDREFRTGSNIPVRGPDSASATTSIDRETWERERALNPTIALPPKGGGR